LLRNLGTLSSWNPLGLSRPVMGLLYRYLYHTDLVIWLSRCHTIRGHYWPPYRT